jgi:hypothetical protein
MENASLGGIGGTAFCTGAGESGFGRIIVAFLGASSGECGESCLDVKPTSCAVCLIRKDNRVTTSFIASFVDAIARSGAPLSSRRCCLRVRVSRRGIHKSDTYWKALILVSVLATTLEIIDNPPFCILSDLSPKNKRLTRMSVSEPSIDPQFGLTLL